MATTTSSFPTAIIAATADRDARSYEHIAHRPALSTSATAWEPLPSAFANSVPPLLTPPFTSGSNTSNTNSSEYFASTPATRRASLASTTLDDTADSSHASGPRKLAAAAGPSSVPQSPVTTTPGTMTGPATSNYEIKPRPKPGRKPQAPQNGQPEPKRRAQNRQAQRDFRMRKQEKLQALEADVKEKVARMTDTERALAEKDSIIEGLRMELEESRRRERELRDRVGKLLEKNRGMGAALARGRVTPPMNPLDASPREDFDHGHGYGADTPRACEKYHEKGECRCLNMYTTTTGDNARPRLRTFEPPSVPASPARQPSHEYFETDYTNFTLPPIARSSRESVLESDDEIQALPHPLSSTLINASDPDPCGFCTNPSNCLCIPQQAPTPQPLSTARSPLPAKDDDAVLMPPPKIKPGTCDRCQADPEQRRFCEGLAKYRPPRSEPLESASSAKRRRLGGSQPEGEVVSCNDAYALFATQHRQDASKAPESFYSDCVKTVAPSAQASQAAESAERDERMSGYSAYDVELAGCLLQLSKN